MYLKSHKFRKTITGIILRIYKKKDKKCKNNREMLLLQLCVRKSICENKEKQNKNKKKKLLFV